jgi:hypothetical protein
MWKLPAHSNRAENPSPMHELSHSVKTLGGKIRVERGKLVAKLCEALNLFILEKLLISLYFYSLDQIGSLIAGIQTTFIS